MSKTNVATAATLAKKVYTEKLYRDVLKEIYWGKFMGSDGSMPIHVKTDLEKSQGETIVFPLRMRLAQSGVTGTQKLEGNEEALTLYSHTVTLEQYRHAVRDDGALTRKRPAFDLDEEADMAIKDWGSEKIDALIFSAILASPTKVFYRDGTTGATSAGSSATAKAALTAANSKLSLNFISAIRTWASSGGARQYIPIRPIRVDGEEMYVLLVHNDALYDLRTDAQFQQAMREARERGKDNPLFKNATAYWDGVCIHSHEQVTIATDGGGASVPWSTGVFFGAQAGLWAWGRRPKIIEKEFDYENEHGKAYDMIGKASKPVFNSLDYGSLGVHVSRTNVSGL